MAEGPDDSEKTEDPSQRKLDDAHKKGDVAKSQEVTLWFGLLAITLGALMLPELLTESFKSIMRALIEKPHEIAVDGENLRELAFRLGGAVLGALAVPLLLLAAGGVLGNMIQHAPVLSAEQMKPKLSKISPMAGFKRLFSSQSLVNFAKGIVKLIIVGIAMSLVLWPERARMVDSVSLDPSAILPLAQMLAIKMLVVVIVVMGLIAAADYSYQRMKWFQKQRMSVKEQRDEYKQMEGDPAVRAKLRQLRIERGRRRMMSAVPQATVIVTNPTHYAIALKYEKGMNAPLCLAKGVDKVALRIREIATDNDVPIVENPPLARALHATVEIDDEIPAEHYKAVAQVIGYVLGLKAKLRRPPAPPHRDSPAAAN